MSGSSNHTDAFSMRTASYRTALSQQEVPLDLVLSALDEAKAENLVTLPLEGKSSFADYMVIVSGNSSRHNISIAENLIKTLKNSGYGNKQPEGNEGTDWVLLDLGNIIVHIFKSEVRDLYALERMWSVRTHNHHDKPILISS